MRLLIYNWATFNSVQGQQIPLDPYTNGFVAENLGNTVMYVNGDPLQPGNSKTVGGNYGEIFGGRLDILFRNDNAVLLPVNSGFITIKYYLSDGSGRLAYHDMDAVKKIGG